MQVPWLERTNFSSGYSSQLAGVLARPVMRSAVTEVTTPARRATMTWPESRAGARLHAGAHDGRLRLQERHGLALHVGAHQGAVGVVVLEEGDERRGHRDDLLGADVHVVDLLGTGLRELVAVAAGTCSPTK